jgi:hypothetical protein
MIHVFKTFAAHFFIVTLVALSLEGCKCSPPNPQAVTLRVNNKTKEPIYVDETSGKLGLQIKRDVNGTKFGFDDLICECRFCKNACTVGCLCPQVENKIRKIEPGKSVDRTWNGVVQVSGTTGCSNGIGDGTCLAQENAPLNESFTLELCYSTQRPTGATFGDGGIGNGTLPMSTRTCIERAFAVQDGTVEIGPERGANCAASSECKGKDELCFDGACTAGCPGNDIPELGTAWNLYVANIDNMGFFEPQVAVNKKVFAGTGTIASFVYQGTSLQIGFKKIVNAETLTGKLTLQLPPSLGPSFSIDQKVSVTFIDAVGTQPNRAAVIRNADTQDLLFAVDMSQNGDLLGLPELAPLAVSLDETAIGCRIDSCGKLIYSKRKFGNGAMSFSVDPGKSLTADLSQGAYTFLNVSSGGYVSTTNCDVKTARPFAIWKK